MFVRRRTRVAASMLALVAATSACGTSTQDLGRNEPNAPPSDDVPKGREELPGSGAAASSWEWLNPAPQGNRIRGVGGSADDDVWLVGDSNTVLHWDGERWSDVHDDLRGLDLYSVWSSGPSDVWAAGDHGVTYRYDAGSSTYTVVPNEGGGVVLRFDGTDWKADPQIGGRWAHAIWGTDATHVLALLEDGDVGQFDGTRWTITPSPVQAVLRDIWGTSPTDIWAVGDGGTIAHFDGSVWTRVQRDSGDPESDPATPTNVFYGVWGSSADDVWAVFRDPTGDDPETSSEQRIGLAHWNGSSWKVAQTIFSAESEAEKHTHKRQPATPLRVGRQLWGGNGGRALAMVYGTSFVLGFDGTTWAPEERLQLGIRTVWGRPGFGALFAAGEGGMLHRFDGGTTPAVSDVFPSFRQSIKALASTEDDLWGIALQTTSLLTFDPREPGELVRWSTGGWARVPLDVTSAEGARCPLAVGTLAAAGANDLWVSGAHAASCSAGSDDRVPDLLHWDGSGWTVISLPERLARPFRGHEAMRVWVPKNGKRPWLVPSQAGPLHRWSGTSWTQVSLPDGLSATGVGGSSDDDIWATGSSNVAGDEHLAVFHFEGSAFAEVFRTRDWHWRADVQATSPNDVWVRATSNNWTSPTTLLRWDGNTWSERRDLNAAAIWPLGDGTAYFLGNDDESADRMFDLADSRYVLGRWDGAKTTLLAETSAAVHSLTMTKDALWIGGEWGATLRYRLGKPPR